MHWFHRRERGRERGPWPRADEPALLDALRRLPPGVDERPWSPQRRGRSVVLSEHSADGPRERDWQARDRRLSCGAAAANLSVAMRLLGWDSRVRWHADEEHTAATVTPTHRHVPDETDRQLARAMQTHPDEHRVLSAPPVPAPLREDVRAAAGRRAIWVTGAEQHEVLARALQRAGWEAVEEAAGELDIPPPRSGQLADAGPLTAMTPRIPDPRDPDQAALGGSVLVVSSLIDGPLDQLRAGAAAQQAWLEAVRIGLVATMITRPLRFPAVREELAAELRIGGVAHLLLRVGAPADPRP
ncbi:hypothetical protein IQ251_12445 [Saccharopolyspora sp. HNM0983]|uniref:Uncharacterized protein n=1 Tax=Saccharopolyspora montiporae TaxID=2781240 RepID=A0A929BBY2_9PSEU|nr:hypothetical protein [Saccharopolyspora sp. HNM0983]MBE9375253.1 hypothetical protein [Saccharopolyspora sp. HNM0983]